MLECTDISKSYGATQALRGLSFRVEDGTILGLVGPNGAGKTTVIRILTGQLFADTGSVMLNQVEAFADPLAYRRMVGGMPDESLLYPEMEVQEYLEFCARARGIQGHALSHRVDATMELLDLAAARHRLLRTLSRGYRQRVGLAQATLHRPALLVLDEPSSGLDPLQIENFHEILRALAQSGTSVLFSTHVMSEVEAIADRVVVLQHGRALAQGSVADITVQARGHPTFRLEFTSDAPLEFIEALRSLRGVSSVTLSEARGHSLLIGLDGPDLRVTQHAVIALAQAHGLAVCAAAPEPTGLSHALARLLERQQNPGVAHAQPGDDA